MKDLPDRVTVTWPHHGLCGKVLEVTGWRHQGGELCLRVLLADGSSMCLPIRWTELAGRLEADSGVVELVTVAGLRELRARLELIRRRTAVADAAVGGSAGGSVVGDVRANSLDPREAPTTRR